MISIQNEGLLRGLHQEVDKGCNFLHQLVENMVETLHLELEAVRMFLIINLCPSMLILLKMNMVACIKTASAKVEWVGKRRSISATL